MRVVAFVGSLLFLAGCEAASPPYDGPARHVIFISLDTTRPDHLGFYGNGMVKTPAMDHLASESSVFDHNMTAVPTTLASHTTLLTGRYPQTHGVPRNGFVVHADNEMLAEILRERAFATAGFIGSFALDSRFNFAQGFDHYDQTFSRLAGVHGREQSERPAEAVTRAVLDYIDRAPPAEHRFLFVHFFDAHSPYEPPPPYDTMYDGRGRKGLPTWAEMRRRCQASDEDAAGYAERMMLQYAAEISYMDLHVGKLLEGLRERGILEEALLVVTSDHGETLWEPRTCFNHGWSTYQATMRAVGLVRLPGAARAGTRIGAPVSSVDMLPTVLRYLGIEPGRGIDGTAIDLAGASVPDPDRSRFGQATKPWEGVETDPRWTNMLKARCIRLGRHKLIQVPYAGKEELYDLEADPNERRDLLAGETPGIAALADKLRGRLEAWAASAHPLPTSFESSQREETIERLKALGYLGGG